MHWKRVRNDIAMLAQDAYGSLMQWASFVRSQRSATHAPDNAESGPASEESDPENHQTKAQRDAFARLVQRIMDGKPPEIDWVTRWVEEHGEDAWISFMTQWQRVSREIVDDMMSDRRTARPKISKDVSSMLRRWESAAQVISEGVVDAMLDSSQTATRRKARRHRRGERKDPL